MHYGNGNASESKSNGSRPVHGSGLILPVVPPAPKTAREDGGEPDPKRGDIEASVMAPREVGQLGDVDPWTRDRGVGDLLRPLLVTDI